MKASYRQVVALTRGLEVLRAASLLKSGTVGSLHQFTGLDKATVIRMLETLMSEGYVAKGGTDDLPEYSVTGKAMQLSSGFVLHHEVARVSDALMDKFAARLEWPVTSATFDGDAMVVAASRGTFAGLHTIRQPGYRFPLLVTAAGLSYVAFLPEAQTNEILDRLEHSFDATGWNNLVKKRADLKKHLTMIKRQGYAMGDDNYYRLRHDGILWGFSVPITGRQVMYGTIGLMILTHILKRGEGIKKYLPALQALAAEIADTLDRSTARETGTRSKS